MAMGTCFLSLNFLESYNQKALEYVEEGTADFGLCSLLSALWRIQILTSLIIRSLRKENWPCFFHPCIHGIWKLVHGGYGMSLLPKSMIDRWIRESCSYFQFEESLKYNICFSSSRYSDKKEEIDFFLASARY